MERGKAAGMSLEERIKRNKGVCDQVVKKYLPKSKYEVTEIYAPEFIEPFRCNISFKRAGYEARVDCDDECSNEFPDDSGLTGENIWKENYDECVRECEYTKRTSIVGAISVDPDTLGIDEATVPASCDHIWFESEQFDQDEDKQREKFEREQEKMFIAFRKVGCGADASTMHPHHFSESFYEPDVHGWPAVCYAHVMADEGKCKLPDLLKVVEKWV